jgi:hypothetical protein
MWLYFSRLHEKYNLPICQVAVLAFDEPQRADPDYYEVRFLDNTVLRLQYRTIQLNRLDWQDFINRDSPIVCAFMAKMRMRSRLPSESQARMFVNASALAIGRGAIATSLLFY